MKINRLIVAAAAALAALAGTTPTGAATSDIHARCVGDKPVITSRPPGTENIVVKCVDGLPEYHIAELAVPTYDPIRQAMPQVVPPDFASWVTVWLNGHPLKTPYNPIRKVQEPGAYLAASTGRAMMPIRFFTEAFGGQVQWYQEERRVRLAMTARSVVVDVWVGQNYARVNGAWKALDQPPLIFADRVFVPARFLGESVGGKVMWDAANRSIRVQLDGASCSSAVYCGEVR